MIRNNFIYEFLRSLFAGIKDKGWCREAERGRDRSQVTLRRRDDREEGQQQAERTPGGAPAARESNYTDTGPAPIAATESLQWSRFVKHSHEEILSLYLLQVSSKTILSEFYVMKRHLRSRSRDNHRGKY